MKTTEDYKKAKELNLTDLDRWEDGMEHHSMSERLVNFMADHDFNDHNNTMRIKIGGDGDNGEQLMFLMDSFFEMLDKTETHIKLDRAIKYARMQYYMGTQNREFTEFDDWKHE